jgi:hypothetical protein
MSELKDIVSRGERKLPEKEVGPVLCRFTENDLSFLLIHPNRFQPNDIIGPERASLKYTEGRVDVPWLLNRVRELCPFEIWSKDIAEDSYAKLEKLISENRGKIAKSANQGGKELRGLLDKFRKISIETKQGETPAIKVLGEMFEQQQKAFAYVMGFASMASEAKQVDLSEHKAEGVMQALQGLIWSAPNAPNIFETSVMKFTISGRYEWQHREDGKIVAQGIREYNPGTVVNQLDVEHLRKCVLGLQDGYLKLFQQVIEHVGVLTQLEEIAEADAEKANESAKWASVEMKAMKDSVAKANEGLKKAQDEAASSSTKRHKRGN